tara:strand:- start:96 stop:479 length:384 start_codon:yes stop_codon:yes gene_type:complete
MSLMPIRGPGSEGPPVTTGTQDPFSYILENQDEVLRDLGITPPGYEVANNPFQFLDKYVRGLPILHEYGNALLSPFMGGGLDSQPLGGSGYFGNNPDGTPRSMGGALKFIGGKAQERNRLINEARRR